MKIELSNEQLFIISGALRDFHRQYMIQGNQSFVDEIGDLEEYLMNERCKNRDD